MLRTFVLLIFCATSLETFAQGTVHVFLEEMKDVTHVEFAGRETWNYKLDSGVNGKYKTLSIEVDKVDPKSIVLLKTLRSPFVEKVEIQNGTDLKDKIVFFLKSQDVQGFDYITDQPSKLVLDFYQDVDKSKMIANKLPDKKKVAGVSKKANRKPAGDFILQPSSTSAPVAPVNLDGDDPDYKRFQIADYEIKDSSIIASKLNLYIHYPMMQVPVEDLQALLETAPQYEIEKTNSDENKKARLLLTLFNKGRSVNESGHAKERSRDAVFLTALELFRKEYPNSQYQEQLLYMEADTYYGLWQKQKRPVDFETAMNLYTKLLLSPGNPTLQDRIMRLVAYSYFTKDDYMSAFTMFEKYLKRYPESQSQYRVKIAMALCLARLNNLADAVKILNQVEENKKSGLSGVEAAYRKGDLYAIVRDYQKAISEYDNVIKKYSKESSQYPNALYNTAESRFWLNRDKENLKRSLNDYVEFIKKYPKNEHVSYAMERVGELLEILGASEKKFNGAFIETIYRYGETEAAGVAKIRLLRARIPSMKEKEINDEIASINKFIQTSQLEKLKEFKTIMIADGYYSRKNYDESLKYLISFYQENPLSNYLDVFKKRIVQTIKDQMAYAVQNDDYLKAFQIYGKNSSVWLKDSNRIDVEYLLGRAFEEAAVPDEAIKKYQEVLNKLYSIRGSQEERERKVFEVLPTTDEVHLNLASMFVFKGDYGKALDNLKEVQEKNLTDDERILFVSLSSSVYEKLNQPELAISNLNKLVSTWRGQPVKLSEVYLRLAHLQYKNNLLEASLQSLNQLLDISRDTKTIADETEIKAFELKAQVAEKLKKLDIALDAYNMLLEKYEDSHSLYSDRYKLGEIYFNKGEVKEAEKVWSPLQDKPEAKIWSQLAQENLKDSLWKDEYKKYMGRIPAMAPEQKKGDKK